MKRPVVEIGTVSDPVVRFTIFALEQFEKARRTGKKIAEGVQQVVKPNPTRRKVK